MQSIRIHQTLRGLVAEEDGRFSQAEGFSLDDLFRANSPFDALRAAVLTPCDAPAEAEMLPPIQNQEVWAAGVTYLRSRIARMEESESSGANRLYDLVYEADRPELFFKATADRVRGNGQSVRIRADGTWNVPEPELTLAVNRYGRIFGYTIGNDMSSRDIEGENPLYLPQAKIYRGSCALGPALTITDQPIDPSTGIALQIVRDGAEAFAGTTDLTRMKRRLDELAEWLFRELDFPQGVYLMTGTGIVPPSTFTLQSGDRIHIEIDGLGVLENAVE